MRVDLLRPDIANTRKERGGRGGSGGGRQGARGTEGVKCLTTEDSSGQFSLRQRHSDPKMRSEITERHSVPAPE